MSKSIAIEAIAIADPISTQLRDLDEQACRLRSDDFAREASDVVDYRELALKA